MRAVVSSGKQHRFAVRIPRRRVSCCQDPDRRSVIRKDLLVLDSLRKSGVRRCFEDYEKQYPTIGGDCDVRCSVILSWYLHDWETLSSTKIESVDPVNRVSARRFAQYLMHSEYQPLRVRIPCWIAEANVRVTGADGVLDSSTVR